jgi:hypothetical protein
MAPPRPNCNDGHPHHPVTVVQRSVIGSLPEGVHQLLVVLRIGMRMGRGDVQAENHTPHPGKRIPPRMEDGAQRVDNGNDYSMRHAH